MIKIKHLTESLNKKYSIEKHRKKLNEEYSLVGQDGNAYSLMGYTARCMKECGLRDEIDEMRERAMSGDYDNLICVCDEYVQRCNEINPDLDEAYSLTEKNWNYTLKSGSKLRKAIQDENYKEVIESIYDCYKELKNNNLIDEDDYYEYTAELDDFMDYDDPEEFINYELNDLYDLCDNLNVWVALNESLNEDIQKEVFDKPGEFWYFTKHGLGPGSVPKGITIEKTIDKDGGEYFLIKDKILSTDALNKYEIKEKIPFKENLLEDNNYNEVVDRDGLPENIEIKDGSTFKAKFDCSKKHPTKLIKVPFNSYDDAEEWCKDKGISTSNIVDENDIFVECTEAYDVVLVDYSINCVLNQYEGNKIVNTFDDFPLEIKNLTVSKLNSKTIMQAVKKKYKNIKLPSNVGVSRNDLNVISYDFKLKRKEK